LFKIIKFLFENIANLINKIYNFKIKNKLYPQSEFPFSKGVPLRGLPFSKKLSTLYYN